MHNFVPERSALLFLRELAPSYATDMRQRYGLLVIVDGCNNWFVPKGFYKINTVLGLAYADCHGVSII